METLSLVDIEILASKPNVKKIAVENFLLTLHNNDNYTEAILNLNLDSNLYKWNTATVKAIRDGIRKAFKKL